MPSPVDKYFDEVKRDNPSYTDEQAWATAWSIYCKYKNPGSDHCHKAPSEYLKKEATLAESRAGAVKVHVDYKVKSNEISRYVKMSSMLQRIVTRATQKVAAGPGQTIEGLRWLMKERKLVLDTHLHEVMGELETLFEILEKKFPEADFVEIHDLLQREQRATRSKFPTV